MVNSFYDWIQHNFLSARSSVQGVGLIWSEPGLGFRFVVATVTFSAQQA